MTFTLDQQDTIINKNPLLVPNNHSIKLKSSAMYDSLDYERKPILHVKFELNLMTLPLDLQDPKSIEVLLGLLIQTNHHVKYEVSAKQF